VTDTPATTRGMRSIWARGLLMILMAVAFQISGTLLALGANQSLGCLAPRESGKFG
jgi:hypothetical protein